MTSIAHYNLLEPLGEGGLGAVYRARDTRVGRTVALKVVPASRLADSAVRASFFEAARASAKLSHPNIATLFDVGDHEGGAYLAYEYTPGVTIRGATAAGSIAPRRAVEIAIQIADALADGHASGIIHGDIRPDNVVVTPKGSAKLLEFGLSSWTRAGAVRVRAADAPVSLHPDVLSIVSYMSPEQALGAVVDPRTDIFSLGVVLYEMLTARHPFAAAGVPLTIANIIQSIPAAPSTIASVVPKDLDALVARALANDAAARHQSAASLSAELRSIGAVLDVRAGDALEADALRFDEDRITPGTWVTMVVIAGLVALAVWYFFLRP